MAAGGTQARASAGLEWICLAMPLGLAALVFARAIGFPFVNWDDPGHFSDAPLAVHPLARGLSGLLYTREIGYPAPLLLLTYALDRVVWGLHPAAYHAEDLLLHLGNVALLFQVARRWRLPLAQACAVATLFAVHPLVVEPVCWVTGRKDLLAAALVLGAALVAMGRDTNAAPSPAWRWVLANVLVLLAVLVLPRAVVGALVLVLLVRGAKPSWSLPRTVARMLPSLAAAVFVVILGARELVALDGVPPPRPAGSAIADVAAAWALQLGHVVFPVQLLAYYFRVPGDPPLWGMMVAAVAGVAILAFAVLRARAGAREGFAWLLVLVAYAPGSGIFVIRRWTSDSYMYLPVAMLGLAIVPLLARAWPARLATFGHYASLALAGVLALLAFDGTARWASSTQVWAGSIARYPDEPLSYEHEALGLLADGRLAEANPLFIQIAERFPDWQDTLDDEVRAYEARGDEAHATEVLRRGVRAGSNACVRLYWLRLLASPRPPPPDDRDLVATAFSKGFEPMKAGLHSIQAFRKVVAILHAVGLDDLAAEAAAHVREMESASGGI
jgi:hypothetical protein